MSDQRFNTGNPIGSNSPLDRSDNTRNFDERMNSKEPVGFDRFGNPQLNWAGIASAGAGDTSIAVDAAARAVAAAGQVEQNAEQIAQDAAATVIASVDGAVQQAEIAAAAALGSGNVYASTGLGLLNTVNGQIFLQNTSNPQVFNVFRNSNNTDAIPSGIFTVAAAGGGSGVPDKSVTRAKLVDQFSFNSVMTSGDLNAQRLPEGSYIVGVSVANRPPGVTGGNAALKVVPVGNWDIQEISSIANPEQIFRRVFRFDNGAFGEWIPFGAGGGGGAVVPDGSITRSKLAAAYGYNSIISTGSLNQQRWNEGSYLVSTGVADRPVGMSGGNAGMVVTHMGAWNQETIINIDRPEQRFTRISRFSNGSFPPWIPTGETMGGNTNRLLGKTIAFLGDSITASSAGFPGKIGVMLGANIINCGIGGTRMGVHTVNGYDRLSGWTIASAIESNDFSQVEAGAVDVGDPGLMIKVNLMKDTDWQSVDYIVVGFGTNDFGGDRQLGLPTDTTEASFYGACDMVMSKLQRACPQARLLFLTPIWRRRTPTHTGGVVGGSDISPNNHGLYLYEFGGVIQEVCKRYHLECLELYYTSGIAEATNLQYLEDELHPNAAGYELMAAKVAGALSSRW